MTVQDESTTTTTAAHGAILTDAAAAKALCVPFPAELMAVLAANPLVNKVGSGVPEGPELLVAPPA